MKENILKLHKSDITGKYRQVFLFVAGVLDKKGADRRDSLRKVVLPLS